MIVRASLAPFQYAADWDQLRPGNGVLRDK